MPSAVGDSVGLEMAYQTEQLAASPFPSVSVPSAVLLHTLPVSAQCDYNASEAEGHRESSARPLKSRSIQHQPNVSRMADAPDSKSDGQLGAVIRRFEHPTINQSRYCRTRVRLPLAAEHEQC
jgi:hypothetical protein